MVIIGFKPYHTLRAVVVLTCARCRSHVPHRVYRRVNKFTLFFIPLFVVSRSYSLECTACTVTHKLSRDEAQGLRDRARSQDAMAAQQRAEVTGYRVINSELHNPGELGNPNELGSPDQRP